MSKSRENWFQSTSWNANCVSLIRKNWPDLNHVWITSLNIYTIILHFNQLILFVIKRVHEIEYTKKEDRLFQVRTEFSWTQMFFRQLLMNCIIMNIKFIWSTLRKKIALFTNTFVVVADVVLHFCELNNKNRQWLNISYHRQRVIRRFVVNLILISCKKRSPS